MLPDPCDVRGLSFRPFGCLYDDWRPGTTNHVDQQLGGNPTVPEIGVAISSAPEAVLRIVGMYEIDTTRRRHHTRDEVLEILACGPRMARIEAEPDSEIPDRLPQLRQVVDRPRNCALATRRVFDEDRNRGLDEFQCSFPTHQPLGDRCLAGRMATMHDHTRGAYPLGGANGHFEESPAGLSNPGTRRHQVDQVGRVHIHRNLRSPQHSGVGTWQWRTPSVGTRQEDLYDIGVSPQCLIEGTAARDVRADPHSHGMVSSCTVAASRSARRSVATSSTGRDQLMASIINV